MKTFWMTKTNFVLFFSWGPNRRERDVDGVAAEAGPGSLQDGLAPDSKEDPGYEIRRTRSGGNRAEAFRAGITFLTVKMLIKNIS